MAMATGHGEEKSTAGFPELRKIMNRVVPWHPRRSGKGKSWWDHAGNLLPIGWGWQVFCVTCRRKCTRHKLVLVGCDLVVVPPNRVLNCGTHSGCWAIRSIAFLYVVQCNSYFWTFHDSYRSNMYPSSILCAFIIGPISVQQVIHDLQLDICFLS